MAGHRVGEVLEDQNKVVQEVVDQNIMVREAVDLGQASQGVDLTINRQTKTARAELDRRALI